MNESNHEGLLRNLRTLIKRASLRFNNEFIWQDINLTNEFQQAFSSYLEKSNYSVEFFVHTAVITSSHYRYIFVPNQWFVIASYVVDIYEELYRYKRLFIEVANRRSIKIDAYAKTLRDSATSDERNNFYKVTGQVLADKNIDDMTIQDTTTKLWRFSTDYSWWSGQKTIDRTDFHMSVILNLLNLVNASQSYVADITSAYANDKLLRNLVKCVEGFTINLLLPEGTIENDFTDDYRTDTLVVGEEHPPYIGSSSDGITRKHQIKIKENTLKTIKYKN